MLAAFRTVVFNLGSFIFFLGVTRASNKNIHIYFSIFIFLMELLFVVAKIIRSPGKNDSLLFSLF